MGVKYSVIIPTYNEELYLESVLTSLNKVGNCEVIISDGGSNDQTLDIAERHNIKIIRSTLGRGIQLNNGIKAANGEILCFLHADTLPPDNAFDLLTEFFEKSDNKICRFKLGFDIDHWLLNLYKHFSKYDSLFTRFGDMLIAVKKDFYYEIGGFPNWKTFEDVEFLRKAAKKTKIKILDAEVNSSARTFTKYGLIRQQIYNGYLMTKYLFGLRKFIVKNKYYKRMQKHVTASIIVFVRYPVEGKVKTRLAATLGNKVAKELYKNFAEAVINSVKKIKNTYKYVFYSDKNEKPLIKKWLGINFIYAAQSGNDLGERMKEAFRIVFSHGAKKAVIVGTDIPDLSKEIINKGIEALENSDVVIGPCKDGGYYLLGIKKYYPQIFEDIKYSSANVLAQTLKKIKESNLTVTLINELQDIDTEGDLIKWLKESENGTLKSEVELYYNLTKGRIQIKCAHCSR